MCRVTAGCAESWLDVPSHGCWTQFRLDTVSVGVSLRLGLRCSGLVRRPAGRRAESADPESGAGDSWIPTEAAEPRNSENFGRFREP